MGFARDPARLAALAEEVGANAGTPMQASAAEVVVLAVPWSVIDQALGQVGALTGRIVIDTTNQFGRDALAQLHGRTAARHNADRMPGARYTKCFAGVAATPRRPAWGI